MEVQAGRSGRRAIISRARFRRPTSVAAKRRCTARVRTVLPGLLVAGAVAFCPAAMAAPSATPSPSPSPTSSSPTPEPSSSSPSPSPTPSPTSPAPTPSPTSPTPTPSPTSPQPTPSPTSPKPSPAPTSAPAPTPSPTRGSKPPHTRSPAPSPSPSSWPAGAPGPAPVWPSFAAHTPRRAHGKKGHRVTAAVKAPTTSHASARAFTPGCQHRCRSPAARRDRPCRGRHVRRAARGLRAGDRPLAAPEPAPPRSPAKARLPDTGAVGRTSPAPRCRRRLGLLARIRRFPDAGPPACVPMRLLWRCRR